MLSGLIGRHSTPVLQGHVPGFQIDVSASGNTTADAKETPALTLQFFPDTVSRMIKYLSGWSVRLFATSQRQPSSIYWSKIYEKVLGNNIAGVHA